MLFATMIIKQWWFFITGMLPKNIFFRISRSFQVYLKDRSKHDQTARDWVQKYATWVPQRSSHWWDLSEGRWRGEHGEFTWRTWRKRPGSKGLLETCHICWVTEHQVVMRISRYLRHFKALIGKQEHENPRYIATSFVWRWAKSWLQNWLDLSSFFQIVDDLEC